MMTDGDHGSSRDESSGNDESQEADWVVGLTKEAEERRVLLNLSRRRNDDPLLVKVTDALLKADTRIAATSIVLNNLRDAVNKAGFVIELKETDKNDLELVVKEFGSTIDESLKQTYRKLAVSEGDSEGS